MGMQLPTMTRPPDAARSRWQRIYEVVHRIPSGKVATYGQVAALAGLPGHARHVGYALHALPDGSAVPWHRVVNAKGRISPRRSGGWEVEQRLRLEQEGVAVDRLGRLSLRRYQWHN